MATMNSSFNLFSQFFGTKRPIVKVFNSMSNLTDIDETGRTDKDILQYENSTSKWTAVNHDMNNMEDVVITAPLQGQVLEYQSGTSEWINVTPAGGGEVNTASNVGGTDGWFKQKTGTDLEFKSLTSGTALTTTNNTDDLTINYTGSLADQSDTGAVGGGKIHVLAWNQAGGNWIGNPAPAIHQPSVFTAGVAQSITINSDYYLYNYLAPTATVTTTLPQISTLGTINNIWNFHVWVTGSNITNMVFNTTGGDTFGTTTGPITITLSNLVDCGVTFIVSDSVQGVWNITNFNSIGVNLGAGSQVFKQKTGNELEYRSLTEGTGISLTTNADDIEIKANGVFLDREYSVTLTANEDNFAPTVGDWDDYDVVLIDAGASNREITGFDSTGVSNGHEMLIVNSANNGDVKLKKLNVGSLAANQFRMSADVNIQDNEAVFIVYSTTLSKWQVANA
jgi:hypothetical protein